MFGVKYRINYYNVINQSNALSRLAHDLEQQIIRLENARDSMSSKWIGEASKTFNDSITCLIADLKETRKDMSSLSTTITNVANRIKEEDEELARRAEALMRSLQNKNKPYRY